MHKTVKLNEAIRLLKKAALVLESSRKVLVECSNKDEAGSVVREINYWSNSFEKLQARARKEDPDLL